MVLIENVLKEKFEKRMVLIENVLKKSLKTVLIENLPAFHFNVGRKVRTQCLL